MILSKFGGNFWKYGLQFDNFIMLGVPEVLDVAYSIFTIEINYLNTPKVRLNY